MPLFIAAAAAYFIARKTTSRIQFLSISLLAGFLANCLLGWIIAGLTFSYLLAAIMQTLAALFTLQYYFEHWDQDYQVGLFLLIKSKSFFLFPEESLFLHARLPMRHCLHPAGSALHLRDPWRMRMMMDGKEQQQRIRTVKNWINICPFLCHCHLYCNFPKSIYLLIMPQIHYVIILFLISISHYC